MRYTLKDAVRFERPNVKGLAFNSHRDFGDMSADILEVSGWHGLVKSLNSTRCFYVLEGNGHFHVGGKEYDVVAGDVLFVPWNTPHDFTGEMKLFVVHSPSFHKELVVSLE
jgi:mannose-6-phosphate isomerase-like protein (cupin superfamily)